MAIGLCCWCVFLIVIFKLNSLITFFIEQRGRSERTKRLQWRRGWVNTTSVILVKNDMFIHLYSIIYNIQAWGNFGPRPDFIWPAKVFRKVEKVKYNFLKIKWKKYWKYKRKLFLFLVTLINLFRSLIFKMRTSKIL